MKLLFLLLMLGTTPRSSFGQTSGYDLKNNLAFNQAIAKNVRFPAASQRLGRSVRAYVGFTVNSQGNYQDVGVINVDSIDESLRQEVDRLWHLLPRQDSKYAGRYVIPIAFMLGEGGPDRLKPIHNQEDSFTKPANYVLLRELSVVGYSICELRRAERSVIVLPYNRSHIK